MEKSFQVDNQPTFWDTWSENYSSLPVFIVPDSTALPPECYGILEFVTEDPASKDRLVFRSEGWFFKIIAVPGSKSAVIRRLHKMSINAVEVHGDRASFRLIRRHTIEVPMDEKEWTLEEVNIELVQVLAERQALGSEDQQDE
jgi:hypothetical protein